MTKLLFYSLLLQHSSLTLSVLSSAPLTPHVSLLPFSLSRLPPAISFFMLVLMPQTAAWPRPEMGPASVTPAWGNWLSLSLAQCGPSLWQRGHMPLVKLPVPLAPPRLKKLVDITGTERQRGLFFFFPTLSEHATVASGEDCTCP